VVGRTVHDSNLLQYISYFWFIW